MTISETISSDTINSEAIRSEAATCSAIIDLGRREHPDHAGSSDHAIHLYSLDGVFVADTNGDPIWAETDTEAWSSLMAEYGLDSNGAPLVWDPMEPLDAEFDQQYMHTGNYGIMGNDDDGWTIVYAEDGVAVPERLLGRSENKFESAGDARRAAELIVDE